MQRLRVVILEPTIFAVDRVDARRIKVDGARETFRQATVGGQLVVELFFRVALESLTQYAENRRRFGRKVQICIVICKHCVCFAQFRIEILFVYEFFAFFIIIIIFLI